jgi:predicted permease
LEVTDLWLPVSNLAGGNITFLRLMARLELGVTVSQLEYALTRAYRQAHANDRDVDDSSSVFTASILAARGPAISGTATSATGAQFRGRIVGLPDRNLDVLSRLGLIGAVVLLIALTTVASLQVMRGLRRRRELGIRLALGIPRGRLVGQIMIESVLLAVVSGTMALLLANGTGGILRAQLSGLRWTETIVDHRTVLFGLAVSLVTSVGAGVLPAILVMRTDVVTSLKASSGGTDEASHLRTALMVAQAALCTVLLASGGLFLQSLHRATDFDRGFDHERLIQVSVWERHAGAEAELRRIAQRLASVPGVEAVGRALTPFGSVGLASKVGPNAVDTVGVGLRGPSVDFIEAEFVRTAGLRVIAGRGLTADDRFSLVTMLNESLARRLFPGGDAVGACVHVREPDTPCREIVGVVRDVRWDVTADATYRAYIPLAQAWTFPSRVLIPNYVYVRLDRPALPADVASIRSIAIAELSRPDDLLQVQRVTEALASQLRPWRLAAVLSLLLGALGLVAAAAGIFGVIAFDVARRTRELGVRIAIGARAIDIVRLVVGSGLRMALLGIGTGILLVLGFGRALMSLLFQTAPFDPIVLGATAAVLLLATVIACIVPAIRALRVSPSTALRAD